jgi:hypothetical protein
MRRVAGIALLLLPSTVLRAAEAPEGPEALLPASTQVYLRWDGIPAHRAAYAKTALGQTLAGETGTFVFGLFAQAREAMNSALTAEQLLSGLPPEELQKVQAHTADAAQFLNELVQRGFVLAGEFTSVDPPRGRAFFILPESGARPGPLFGTIQLGLALAKVPVTESKIADRTVSRAEIKPVHLAWWTEKGHAVFYVGTDAPDAILREMLDAAKPKLTANPLFRRIVGFREFETSARSFVDLPAVVKLAAKEPKAAKLVDDLGLVGAGEIAFYYGYDGTAQRERIEWSVPGPRKGLLKLLEGAPLQWTDLPPLPPDVIGWSISNLAAQTFYDVGLQAIERLTAFFSPEDVESVKSFQALANTALGIDLRKDLLGGLGNKIVFYTAPSEGPLVLGQTMLIQVKDGKKLQSTLDQAVKSLLKTLGKDVSLRKRTYRGAEVREIRSRTPGFFFEPTYSIHNGWLAISFFPQAIQGYIARADGRLERWQPTDAMRAVLDSLPKKAIRVSYSDPRPALRLILSFAPVIAGTIKSFSPEVTFEIDSIPNAQEVTRLLFPDVSVATDDGKVVRLESRSSLGLTLAGSGTETFGLFLLFNLGDLF